MNLIKLYGVDNPRTQKILFAASLANKQIQYVCVQFHEIESPEFLKLNKLGKLPVLETPQGILLESNAILKYVVEGSPLLGKSEFEQAKVQQWLDFASTELEPSYLELLLPILGQKSIKTSQEQKATQTLNWLLNILEQQFIKSNFLVGDSLTIADINLNSYLKTIFTFMIGDQERLIYPNLLKYHDYIQTIPQWIEYFGRTRYCKYKFSSQLVQEQLQLKQIYVQQKSVLQKSVKQRSNQTKDEKEQQFDQQIKDRFKNQFDSHFELDKWKRYFLASKDLDAEFQWLWSNLNQTMWSAWEIVFLKSENDGKDLNKTINTVYGFLNWLKPTNFFAIHGVYGNEPDLQIRGAWLWRGTDIYYDLKNHPSYEFLQITRLNIDDQQQRVRFEEYWLNQKVNESQVQGLTARFVKCFK